ncbi:MAG: MaoC family dehydratase [Anaerolineae bacterium]|jgi:3-hydroxybutyryl-CoA dehydratase|nr:MaoC family dehydratase [Anaerolineae bacterium]MBT7074601.1 MaoC family dehydratase [Anaerolineae bacterium]
MIKIGDSASFKKTFSDADVYSFSEISGDKNPVHLNAEYAAKTPFKRPIVHGMLTAGLISAVLGTELPGKGSIYLSQSMNFRAPVFIGDTICATVTVTKVREGKPIITLETICKNQDDIVVIEGEAVLLAQK